MKKRHIPEYQNYDVLFGDLVGVERSEFLAGSDRESKMSGKTPSREGPIDSRSLENEGDVNTDTAEAMQQAHEPQSAADMGWRQLEVISTGGCVYPNEPSTPPYALLAASAPLTACELLTPESIANYALLFGKDAPVPSLTAHVIAAMASGFDVLSVSVERRAASLGCMLGVVARVDEELSISGEYLSKETTPASTPSTAGSGGSALGSPFVRGEGMHRGRQGLGMHSGEGETGELETTGESKEAEEGVEAGGADDGVATQKELSAKVDDSYMYLDQSGDKEEDQGDTALSLPTAATATTTAATAASTRVQSLSTEEPSVTPPSSPTSSLLDVTPTARLPATVPQPMQPHTPGDSFSEVSSISPESAATTTTVTTTATPDSDLGGHRTEST